MNWAVGALVIFPGQTKKELWDFHSSFLRACEIKCRAKI